jgi:dCMP deaminase
MNKSYYQFDSLGKLIIPAYEDTFFRLVYLWASQSKSLTTKIGAILVDEDERDVFSHGFNGLPRKVNDNVPERMNDRVERTFWDIHAENNAILNCVRRGHKTKGSIMFTNALPCSHCAGAIIQAGIKRIVTHRQWRELGEKTASWQRWIESAKRSSVMFQEARIELEEYDGILGVEGFLDGKIVEV